MTYHAIMEPIQNLIQCKPLTKVATGTIQYNFEHQPLQIPLANHQSTEFLMVRSFSSLLNSVLHSQELPVYAFFLYLIIYDSQ